MKKKKTKVLCVDDEPLVLEGLSLQLRRGYDVHTATSGPQGLEEIEKNGPFVVVLSDMRMPGMDGAAFLQHVRKTAPDTMRMLLTGHADVNSAISAVNEGRVFRFLTKPCPRETLLESFKDATEKYLSIIAEQEHMVQLLEEARTDRLTQLPNRNSFDKSLNRETSMAGRQASPLSLLMIDVDHFKKFNDTYGHQAGDSVLSHVGEAILRTVRACDTPARYGGEEFAVILPFTTRDNGRVVAERLRCAIETMTVNWQEKELKVTVSVGGATIDGISTNCDSGNDLVKEADMALYKAKDLGRNRVNWDQPCSTGQTDNALSGGPG